jgi:alpha-N-arabinofuranosidase
MSGSTLQSTNHGIDSGRASTTAAELRLGRRTDTRVEPGLFGGFVEHFGTALYGGVWDLEGGHPRADVRSAVRAMGVTMLRYPGGCFSDWYHWRDGIGDPAERPLHERQFWTGFQLEGVGEIPHDLAERFGPPEPNAFGTDEFLRYCNDVGAEPLLTVNFGTGTPAEAAEWVAYVNRRPDSPRSVKWWGIGNEIYGNWELGHTGPEDYGRRAREYAAAMRAVDPGIRLMVVGTADRGRNHPGWNEAMLRAAGDAADIVSLHFYYPGAALGRQLADTPEEMQQLLFGAHAFAHAVDHSLREVDAVRPGLPVAVDEWGLWSEWADLMSRNHRLCESIFFGGVFNRMIERAGRVRFAMISHLVNCMGTIQTSGPRMHVTAGNLAFQLYTRHLRTFLVPVEAEAPLVYVPPFSEYVKTGNQALGGTIGEAPRNIPVVDAAAVSDPTGTTIFACSAADEPVRTTIHGLPADARGRARWISGPSPYAQNDFDAPTTLGFAEAPCTTDAGGRLTIELQPGTVTALVFDSPRSPDD